MHERFALSARASLPVFFVAAAISPAFAQQQSAKPAAPAATVPDFTVTITYSQKAMDTLVSRRETVIVAAYVSGFPKPGTPRKYIEDDGTVYLGGSKKEITPGASATFGKIDFDPAALKHLDNQGPQLLINVYSGRKSSPDNLLNCSIYQDLLSKAKGKTLPIACKLIGE